MTRRIVNFFWGDLGSDEFKKFFLLAIGFFFLIGSYWPLKVLKDSVFMSTVGVLYQPYVKYMSLILFFPVVLLYSKLADYFPREKLIYTVLGLYGTVGLLFVYLFMHPTIGLANYEQSPTRLLGWGFYVFVESYISLMISLYWAFINDVTTPESAKKGYGLLMFGSQSGAVFFILVGRLLSNNEALYASRSPIIALISVLMFFVVAMIVFVLTKIVRKKELSGYEEPKSKDHKDKKEDIGFLDGLKIFLKNPYVAGIFGTVFFYEVVTVIMNYQLLLTTSNTFMPNRGLVNKFLFNFDLIMHSSSCLFALFGTSFFQRKLGIRWCLFIYPLFLGFSISFFMYNPVLMFIAGVIVVAKGINYAFHQPVKEILYIPTSQTIKYKSKAWVDMFGVRFAKMSGSFVNNTFGMFVHWIGLISMGIIFVWMILANWMGQKYDKIISKGEEVR